MTEDRRIRWELANPFGIWMAGDWPPTHGEGDPSHAGCDAIVEGDADQWNTGHVNDVLRRSDGSLIVAADSGGIWWLQNEGDLVLCLSDSWPDNRFSSLALGPDDPEDRHLYAGGLALYVTDLTSAAPLVNWVQITSLPPGYGGINRIVVMPASRRIVVACTGGMFWSPIPTPPTTGYTWQAAVVDGITAPSFYDAAAGPSRVDRTASGRRQVETVIAGGEGETSPGLFFGDWDETGTLRLHQARFEVDGSDEDILEAAMVAVAVGTCSTSLNRAYAVCAMPWADDSPHLMTVARSDDGGRRWRPCGLKVEGYSLDLRALAVHQGSYNNAVAVSNSDPDVVAMGFNNTFISFNGGDSWHAQGIDASGNYTTGHLHSDIHGLRFTDVGYEAPRQVLVASDGGLAAIEWGKGGWILESDALIADPGGHERGRLEAVVLQGNRLVQYTRSGTMAPFEYTIDITDGAISRPCMIQSDFLSDNGHGHFELVVLENKGLVHYWHDYSVSPAHWQCGSVVSPNATGPGCIIQSNFAAGDHGNFEVVVLEGTDLVHYWLDSANPATGWHRSATITSHAASEACLIQSTIGSGGHGNFELVVLEDSNGAAGAGLVHYWRDNNDSTYPWYGPIMIDRDASAAGMLIQADFGSGDNTNFELLVPQGKKLVHWYRDNSSTPYEWIQDGNILAPGDRCSGPACAFQGNFGTDEDHGNIEVIVPEESKLVHYWFDAAHPSLPWRRGPTIADGCFTYRSRFNRQLPILQFHPQSGEVNGDYATMGVSTLVPGLVAGGTQDNGVVSSTTEGEITPWFEPLGGDGIAAAFLAARSPLGFLFANGRVLVANTNDPTGPPKSFHWVDDSTGLVGYPPANNVIPIGVGNPSSPPADPAAGLTFPRMEAVTRPEFLDRGRLLSAVAAVGADVFGLFVGDATDQGQMTPPLDWEYLTTIPHLTNTVAGGDGNPIKAVASKDGRTILVGALARVIGPFPGATEGRIFSIDAGKPGRPATLMAMDPAVAGALARGFAIVSDTEAYAITDAGTVIRWDGTQWSPTAPLPMSGVSLVAIAAELDLTPASVFVASHRAVAVSTNGGGTWHEAPLGLPAAIECSDLRWVAEGPGARLYLSTYGRSVWVARKQGEW